MSRFINHLQCETTGRRFADHPPISFMKADASCTYHTVTDSVEYRLMARLEAQFVAPSGAIGLEHSVRKVKQQMVEEMFGEFREPLMLLRRDLMSRNYEAGIKRVEEILDQMFVEGF